MLLEIQFVTITLPLPTTDKSFGAKAIKFRRKLLDEQNNASKIFQNKLNRGKKAKFQQKKTNFCH